MSNDRSEMTEEEKVLRLERKKKKKEKQTLTLERYTHRAGNGEEKEGGIPPLLRVRDD